MNRNKTLKITDTETKEEFLPINWSFIYLGDSRVYDELSRIQETNQRVETYADNKQELINSEIKRLEELGFKVETITVKELNKLNIKHNGDDE